MELNQKIKNLSPYVPIVGDFKVRLDANESFIPLSHEMREKLLCAISCIDYKVYPDTLALDACSAFADFYGVSKDNVTACNGSDEIISVILSCFFEKENKIVLSSPDFSMYKLYAHLAETQVLLYNKDNMLEIDTDSIIEFAQSFEASGIMLSNPCNPTSRYNKREEIIKIISALSDKIVIIDEAYMDFCDTNESVIDLVNTYDNLIVLKTCSKFGFAAIRLGFAVAGKKLSNALRAVKSPYNVNTLTNLMGAEIFKNSEYLKHCIGKIKEQRVKLYNLLKDFSEFKVYISGTNFVTVYTSSATKIYNKLFASGIAVRNFGNYLRITAGSDDDHQILIDALKNSINL